MIVTCFFFQAEDGIRETSVTGVQTCALPIYQPPDDPIGDEGWQTVVKLRKLDSHVAVISRPGLVGALSGQRHLHLAAGELADEIKGGRRLVPDRLLQVPEVALIILLIVLWPDDHLGVLVSE